MLRLMELGGDLGKATHEIADVAEGLRQTGQTDLAEQVEKAATQASQAHHRLEERFESLGEENPCPECGAAPVKLIGESCQRATEKMPVEDYYGDGSNYVAVGSHNQGWECAACGEMDAEPCIHD